jgi:hypothetical protein
MQEARLGIKKHTSLLWWERCIAAVTKPVAERWIRRDHQPRRVSVRRAAVLVISRLGV